MIPGNNDPSDNKKLQIIMKTITVKKTITVN